MSHPYNEYRKNTDLSRSEQYSCDKRFRDVLNAMKKGTGPNTDLLKKAYDFAYIKHDGQRRQGGDPFLTHPLEVAYILADLGLDSELVAAALLHDTVEDCDCTIEEINAAFGPVIAATVYGVTQITAQETSDPEMQKADVDALSDNKFLKEILEHHNLRALFVKLADRMHNLDTIDCVSEEKQKAKVQHTLHVLLPAAYKLGVYVLAEQLETQCMKITNEPLFNIITDRYQKLLNDNYYSIAGPEGFMSFFRDVLAVAKPEEREGILSLHFNKRCADSIYRNLPVTQTHGEIAGLIDKQHVPLMNIHFTVSNEYQGEEYRIFMKLYPRLYHSRFRTLIKGFGKAKTTASPFLLLEDRFHNRYRLFISTESDLMQRTFGFGLNGRSNTPTVNLPYLNLAEPDEPERPKIHVYLEDGQLTMIEKGATVLDLAFKLNPDMGLCCKGAMINGSHCVFPIHTRLNAGDVVVIRSDHFREPDKEDIPHATIRWFEYLHTREAVHVLSRWLETRAESSAPPTYVYLKERPTERLEIPMGSTVLDFVLIYRTSCLSGFFVYLNKSSEPAKLSSPLRYGDIIRIVENRSGAHPELSWFGILRTQKARDILLKVLKTQDTQEP
ncbi:MAG: HD domain-containing protein [Blautia sp.]|nr:HD domain-containing protein [Blautia sp.]